MAKDSIKLLTVSLRI